MKNNFYTAKKKDEDLILKKYKYILLPLKVSYLMDF